MALAFISVLHAVAFFDAEVCVSLVGLVWSNYAVPTSSADYCSNLYKIVAYRHGAPHLSSVG